MKNTGNEILILEDNSYVAEELSAICKKIDNELEVYCCKTRAEAEKAAKEGEIDIFIIDIILDEHTQQDVSGLDFVTELRQTEAYKFSPVIFVTSLWESKIFAYDKLHCYAYLDKPFEPEEAERMIREALEMVKRYQR